MNLRTLFRNKILSSDRRLFELPFQAELYTTDQLNRHAEFLASNHKVVTVRGSNVLLNCLDQNEVSLRHFQREEKDSVSSSQITPAAEWLLDNFYLIEEQIQIARRHLPRGYSRGLPRLLNEPSKGFPRVYDIILEFISHQDAQVSYDSLSTFLDSYQKVSPLTLGELWAVPIMLRLALIENLRRIAMHLSAAREDRALAHFWIERMQQMSKINSSHVVTVLSEMAKSNISFSHAFVAEFCQRIPRQNPVLQIAQDWLMHSLAKEGHTIEKYVHQENQMKAINQITVSNSIASLRHLKVINWKDFVENLSLTEKILSTDPSGIYASMDFSTRDQYRKVVETFSRFSLLSEEDVARKSIQLAEEGVLNQGSHDRSAHVGYYLIDDGKPQLEEATSPRWPFRAVVEKTIVKSPLSFFLGGICSLTLLTVIAFIEAALALGINGWKLWVLSIPFTLAASQMAVTLMNWLTTVLIGTRLLPRLDYSKGIPADCETIVVIPTMLTNAEVIDRLLESLEIQFLSNRDHHIHFALLTDYRDATTERLPEDQALLERVSVGIKNLQQRYAYFGSSVFFLFHRPRLWNPSEEMWMGRERKRGKLEDLNGTLRGHSNNAFSVILGDESILHKIKYVITLDTDTQMPREAPQRLIGTLSHPLNKAEIDPGRNIVTRGYGILQPRVGISLPSANRSWFVRLFAGDSGIDPYTRAVSNTYQDLFGEGSFVGKGIYDVDAFEAVLHERFPDNKILSHDLIESCYSRSGLISDVELFENFPHRYHSDVDRRRRWIRGDWQIMQWIFPTVPNGNNQSEKSGLSLLSRWKIYDNLRRSLVSSALVLFLLGGWILFPQVGYLFTLVILALLLFPEMTSSVADLSRRSKDMSRSLHIQFVLSAFTRKVIQTLLTLVFLPYDAFMSLSAIIRSITRVFITKKKLLEWKTSGDSDRDSFKFLRGYYRTMWICPLITLCLVIISLFRFNYLEYLMIFPILMVWLIAPWIAWYISQSLAPPLSGLSSEQTVFLHMTARKTWWFFEKFSTEKEHWLPPDNYQEEMIQAVASRTSPTNIGLSLLANLTAYDFGYISAGKLIQRTKDTLATLQKLEKHRGHFFNWYDTRTLEPLNPRYVSTVDSGNLAGMLLTLASGLRELIDTNLQNKSCFSGLADTIAILRGTSGDQLFPKKMEAVLSKPHNTFEESDLLLHEIKGLATDYSTSLEKTDDETQVWTQNLIVQCEDFIQETNPSSFPTSSENGSVLTRSEELRSLATDCDALSRMEWGFLFEPVRKLFSVGYNMTEQRLDSSYYDLLASEARLTSYIAIAQGEVEQEHWFSLGRLLVAARGETVLLSWSGSMFEYLMPHLIMPSYVNTLIDQSCIAAVDQQINYGKARKVPWGISESGYNRTDSHLNYQYRAFGVPGIGLKRGLEGDLVIAPYASALALMVSPQQACSNLQLLAEEGRSGEFGFYEAVDYTPSRMPPKHSSVTIRSFMAHHQGMILLSLLHLIHKSPMQRRFAANPMLKSADLLLQERVPRSEATVFSPALNLNDLQNNSGETIQDSRIILDPNTPAPEVHLLSNGRYHVAISSAGGGFSKWKNLAVTRWREDATRDCWGYFIYMSDVDSGKLWSVALQPTLHETKHYEAIFSQGRAEFRQRHIGLLIHTEIGVSPEDDVELRRVTITNRSNKIRTIEFTSYAEVVMAPQSADVAHRAFSNLFVQTEFDRDSSAIICSRRSRSHEEKLPCMLHMLIGKGGKQSEVSCETDRSHFIGRNGTLSKPAAILGNKRLSNTTGSVLDPIVSLRRRVKLLPGEEATLVFVLGMGEDRQKANDLIHKYQNLRMTDRAFELAWTHSQVALRQLNATSADAQLFSRLAGSLIYANPSSRADSNTLRRNRRGQSSLWAYGISGDVPIVFLRIANNHNIEIVEQLVKAHSYWHLKGLAIELVIVNEDVSAYHQTLHDAIISIIMLGIGASTIDKPGGIFVRRHEQIADENLILLESVARIVFNAKNGSVLTQLNNKDISVPVVKKTHLFHSNKTYESTVPLLPRELIFNNGFGGFTPDGQEYIITLQPGQSTPAPWVNVIANRFFGTMISESGSSYTWLENAQQFPLTPWNNDQVKDTSGESFYIRDDESGEFWSPTPMPACGATPYVIRHGFGYSIFEHTEKGISSELCVYVATDAPVKFAVLKIKNICGRPRKISATAYFEWVLAELRVSGLMHAQTEIDHRTGALLARNCYSAEFPDRVVFVDVNEASSVTGDRREFIGRNGRLSQPAALTKKELSGKVGAGLDPCGALMVPVNLRDGEEREIIFRLGVGRSKEDLNDLIMRFREPDASRAALEDVWKYWNQTLGTVNVQTPDSAVNMMANGWLLYQTISCRMWGRTGFYQSGGAYGFRDQLQDSMALIHAEPALVRKQLLRAAAHQFQEGDVQHWWHPPAGRGVRTHFSDDFLWLPFVACHYVTCTGDIEILKESVPFLEGRPVGDDEEAYYDLPIRSEESATLYEHCVRAIENGMKYGTHGMPLMGCGDWNDGMNRIGKDGKGESVWLAFFQFTVFNQFAKLANQQNDQDFAERCIEQADTLQTNIEKNAWDGSWYHRAYADDGTVIGSHLSEECQIDSLPQSWSVISGAGSPERTQTAMQAVNERLVRRNAKLIQLFDPPFDHSGLDPGYIKGYIPGIRENGGQYTHGAIWAVMAYAILGEHDRAWKLFNLLNPVNHGATQESINIYKVEPYVVAADVYALPPHTGRGGWTWYTGSAGWMYRLLIETLLGLNLEGTHLRLEPRLPSKWKTMTITYRYRQTRYHITYIKSQENGPSSQSLTLDGVLLPDQRIPLIDEDRDCHARLELV